MFKLILVAIAGAVAAQLTAATLTLSASAGSGREAHEAPPAAIRLANLARLDRRYLRLADPRVGRRPAPQLMRGNE
jgi:hypothetical protein